MLYLDWSKEGWRVYDRIPVAGEAHGTPVALIRSEDFQLPPGSQMYLQITGELITHGWVVVPLTVEELRALEGLS